MLLVLGINHTTAPFSIRQKAAFAQENIQPALMDFLKVLKITEGAILSTCNRTEFYCSYTKARAIIEWWQQYLKIDAKDLEPYLYCHVNEDAVRHMMEVACGLDSMILGESQILGQLKTAFEKAKAVGALGKYLDKLFQFSFNVAKHIRTQTGIAQNPVSIAYAATHLAKKIFSDLTKVKVLLIGAGENIELVALHLHQLGIQYLKVANRSWEGAQRLAKRFNGQALLLEDIAEHLPEIDIVISSTASPNVIVTLDIVNEALKLRTQQHPIFMVDLAVPCDIDPLVSEHPDVHLYTIDDLQHLVDMNKAGRQKASLEAKTIIDKQVQHYIDWVNSHKNIQSVSLFRQKMDKIKKQELNKALNLLQNGVNPQMVIEQLAHNLTQKLIHEPTIRLKTMKTVPETTWLDSIPDPIVDSR